MKIQVTINDTYKGIKILESATFEKVIEALDKMFPNNSWKEFTLEMNTEIIYWTNPIVYPIYPSYPTYPWYAGTSTRIDVVDNIRTTTTGSCTYYNDGTYNVQIGE